MTHFPFGQFCTDDLPTLTDFFLRFLVTHLDGCLYPSSAEWTFFDTIIAILMTFRDGWEISFKCGYINQFLVRDDLIPALAPLDSYRPQ